MTTLTLFYDPHCGLCATFKAWLLQQKAYVRFEFIAYDAPEAEARFPSLAQLQPDKDIVVLSDEGHYWQGPSAWLTCLWALREYRSWAMRFSSPTLLPTVRKLCYLISQHRGGISKFVHLRSDSDLARDVQMQQAPTPKCNDGRCKID